jgi:hypothetical protein
METISTIDELKNAIRLAEIRQSICVKMLKEQFDVTFASLKSGNLLMKTIKEVASIRGLGKLVVVTAFGLTTGSLSKRIIAGMGAIAVRMIIELILKFRATKSISTNARAIEFSSRSLQQPIIR